ncbi:ribosome rescue protein RqcH [Nitrosopumilus sp.]|uniref:ribosome rescue protein RqcH n=1 Tax=Nitrosopumilus sp. TaxID=2024843 RepID=UPI00262D1A41|nr:ribosome rescue protein RqcH [Nitrosopumilus sp.]
MTLAGIELRYLVDTISKQVEGYYVSNIYGITKDSILFKLHHTEKSDLFLMISTMGIWLTSVKIDQIEPNKLQKRLRNDILRLKLKEIKQIGSERIAYFTFEGFGKEFVLVTEFFGDGNIILCSDQMKILALQHSIDVRHRKLGVGLEYIPPPQNGLDIFNIDEKNFHELKQTDLIAAKWLGRTLGLPKKYAEGVFKIANLDSKIKGSHLTFDEIKLIFQTTQQMVSDVTFGNHKPVIIESNKPEVYPINFNESNDSCIEVNSFIEGLDKVFTESLVNQGKTIQSTTSNKKIQELESQLSEQEKAIEVVKERSNSISNVANSLFELISIGITSIQDSRSIEKLETLNAKLLTEKGISFIVIADEKIKINYESSLQSIASNLFNEAKHQARAITSIEEIKNKTQKKLEKLLTKTESEENSITVSNIRKKNWYERYRWFFTTDGYLAIGGRDAASNSAVVRKHLSNNDKIFHADIFGSPFFILKDANVSSSISMNEVAHATVCFSRAWREGLYGVSSYWVNPDQVKKSAPSGEFLPKGSFTIEGQRNFIKAQTLKLAVGILPQDDSFVLTCGPVEPIKKNSILYAVIEPHGIEMVEAAKKIKNEFTKLNEDVTKSISIDDFVRVLPAGKSQVKEIKHGNFSLV